MALPTQGEPSVDCRPLAGGVVFRPPEHHQEGHHRQGDGQLEGADVTEEVGGHLRECEMSGNARTRDAGTRWAGGCTRMDRQLDTYATMEHDRITGDDAVHIVERGCIMVKKTAVTHIANKAFSEQFAYHTQAGFLAAVNSKK